ncbi:MAG: hypothetical protein AB7E81_01875 [Hyphomicrobiaceae bacterium]
MTNTPTLGGGPPQSASEPAVEAGDLDAAAAALIRTGPLTDEPPDPVELVRLRLGIDDSVSDVSIAVSLAQISSRTGSRERWLAAFGSPLGKYLARRGNDLTATLDLLLALASRPPN